MDFLTDTLTFRYDEVEPVDVEELYVADTTVLESPVYDVMLEDFTIDR
jgi:hypothetical protein